jgi:EAL domain-containing protein (putative c-di-GMP-specific phosphodiesterase class I)/GAF domain-containing protein
MSHQEQARLSALQDLNLLDTPPSESFDRITRMASQLFNLPIAAVSLIDKDRQWFKSRVGMDLRQCSRDKAPCAQVAETREVLVLPDVLKDPYYSGSLLAESGMRFYAGAPLVTRDGFGLGSMCVIGTAPREITEQEKTALKDLAAMVMAQIELQHAFGRVDPATGLPNRNQFLEDVEDLMRDHPGERRFAVLIDLMDTGQLSQALRVIGPSYVDDLVKGAARAIRQALSADTKLYRIGSTHYGFLLGGLDDGARAAATEAVRKCVGSVIQSGDIPVVLNAAIGVAPFRLGELAPLDVLRTAHSAAQDAREAEAGVETYSVSRDDVHRRRFTLLADIRDALARPGQLSLAYQPRVDVRSGTCVGAEALLRWNHPTLGDVPPGEFIPLVEQTALARDVTNWVVDAAIEQIIAWRAKGIDIPVSINVAAPNLEEEDFAARVIEKLRSRNVPPQSIELELTESTLIRNGRRAVSQLEALSAAGVRIAIDDFGSGYSSLSYLQRIPASVVKIDRSFMQTLAREERTRTLVSAMISMIHDLGYRVVAEGVETAELYDFLAGQACDEAQGYWISRPATPAAFERWLAENRLPSGRAERTRPVAAMQRALVG